MKHLEEVIINYDKKLMEANKEIEKLRSIIKEVTEMLEKYEYDNEANRYSPVRECLDILRGEDSDKE